MKIGNLNTKDKVIIVAEIGNNHEGDYNLAEELIALASDSGADAVKFQTFKTEDYISITDKKRFKLIKSFELNKYQFRSLSKYATEKQLSFISTPFDIESASYLDEIVDAIKISSSDNNFFPLLKTVAEGNSPIIMSTGLLNIDDLQTSINYIVSKAKNKNLKEKLAILHCVTSYRKIVLNGSYCSARNDPTANIIVQDVNNNDDEEPDCPTNDTALCGNCGALDCNDECNGGAFFDVCNVCAGGSTGNIPGTNEDLDEDGFDADEDNCPDNYNPSQADIDGDGDGDACDVCDNANVFVVGNVNGDLDSNNQPRIDFFDVVSLLDHLQSNVEDHTAISECHQQSGNINADNNVNIIDVVNLVNMLLFSRGTTNDFGEIEDGIVSFSTNVINDNIILESKGGIAGFQFNVMTNADILNSIEDLSLPEGWSVSYSSLGDNYKIFAYDQTGNNSLN